MIVISCQHETRHKHGKNKCGNQRYKCADCGATFVDESGPLGEMRLDMKQATMALSLMLEGMSIRSVQRLTGLCRDTLCDLVVLVGENCQRMLEATVKGVEVKDVQVDEIWSFIGCKERTRVARGKSPMEFGDSWTWLAIERETKLILAHQIGQRDSDSCWSFLLKLKSAIGNGRFQLTSDGLKAYTNNVPFAFQSQVDFAQLIKVYSSTQETTRYSPAAIISAEKLPIFGAPDEDKISTSHIERFNLTYRMSLRRFTRLTNAHSKSLRHHAAMQALFVAWYNFGRKHEALKGSTPAMASKLTDHVWTIKELIERRDESVTTESEIKWFRYCRRRAALSVPIFTCLLAVLILVAWALIRWTTIPSWLPMLPIGVMAISVLNSVITFFYCGYKLRQLERELLSEASKPTH